MALDPIHIPSPEQLVVAVPQRRDPGIDWEAVRKRLRKLGAISFQLDTFSEAAAGSCAIWPRRRGQTQGIEVRAGSESDAIQQARRVRSNGGGGGDWAATAFLDYWDSERECPVGARDAPP